MEKFNQPLHRFLLEQNYTPLSLLESPARLFTTQGTINNQNMLFIVDTGASDTCLDIQSATQKLNLVASELNDKVIGFGATDGARSISFLEKIALGDFAIADFAISVIDLSNINMALHSLGFSPIDGIIGADILAKYNALISYENKYLYLKKNTPEITLS